LYDLISLFVICPTKIQNYYQGHEAKPDKVRQNGAKTHVFVQKKDIFASKSPIMMMNLAEFDRF